MWSANSTHPARPNEDLESIVSCSRELATLLAIDDAEPSFHTEAGRLIEIVDIALRAAPNNRIEHALGALKRACLTICRHSSSNPLKGMALRHGSLPEVPKTSQILLIIERLQIPVAQDVAPKWQHDTKLLTTPSNEVRKYGGRAKNCHEVLNEFERQGWPKRIDDPLPYKEGIDSVERVKSTCESLNTGLSGLKFRVADGGKSIIWETPEKNVNSP